MKTKIITVALMLAGTWCGISQGFVNLDFENATIVHDPQGGYPSSVYASNAILRCLQKGLFLKSSGRSGIEGQRKWIGGHQGHQDFWVSFVR